MRIHLHQLVNTTYPFFIEVEWGDLHFPVSVDKIKRVIVGLAQLETIEAKTKNPELHGELGLNSPSSKTSPSTSVSLIGNKNHILATNGEIHKEMLAFTKPVVESLNG